MTYLTRMRPVNGVDPFRELDRWIDQTLGEALGGSQWRGETLRQWFPLTDVSETPEHLTLRLEVPGMAREDVKIAVENQTLTVRGEKKQETTRENETVYRTERSYGAFERSFTLPGHFDQEQVRASLADGVLTIRIPRREEAKAREVAIEGGEKRISG